MKTLPGKSLYRGKVTIPLVQLSTNCRIGCWCIEKYFFQVVNNQAAQLVDNRKLAVLSPSPCIKMAYLQVPLFDILSVTLGLFIIDVTHHCIFSDPLCLQQNACFTWVRAPTPPSNVTSFLKALFAHKHFLNPKKNGVWLSSSLWIKLRSLDRIGVKLWL